MFLYAAPKKLDASHDTSEFDCGQADLNTFIKKHALNNQRAGSSTTYVLTPMESAHVAAYYALAFGSVDYDAAPDRVKKGLARHPVPAIILARLAVDVNHQKRGIATDLVKDAIMRVLAASEIAGLRVILTHAKDDNAARFYRHLGFEPSPTNEHHLFLLLKDARALMAKP